jgi:hypothetical protein
MFIVFIHHYLFLALKYWEAVAQASLKLVESINSGDISNAKLPDTITLEYILLLPLRLLSFHGLFVCFLIRFFFFFFCVFCFCSKKLPDTILL